MDPNRMLTSLDTFYAIRNLCREKDYRGGPIPASIQHYLAQVPESELYNILKNILFSSTPDCNVVRVTILTYLR